MRNIIAEIEKNKSEIIRVELSEFNGHDLIGLRVYVNRDDGAPVPTKKGITCNVSLIPELKLAILKAEQEAIDAGLLQRGIP